MKKYLPGLYAFIIAIIGLAFTVRPSAKAEHIYVFNGSSDAVLSNRDCWQHTNYRPPESCSEVNETICYIITDRDETSFYNFIAGKTCWTQFLTEDVIEIYTREVY